MEHRKIIVFGGASFIVGALAFVIVFSYLAANFNYPAILDGSASEVLPRLLTGGSTMRGVWAIYAFLPLMLLPGAIGAYFACPSSRARMTTALIFATIATFSMCLGLMRWPSINWAIAEAYSQVCNNGPCSLDAVFNGMNIYLGNYIGEFLGETTLAVFFLLTSISMLNELKFPKWFSWAGIFFAFSFFLGAFRNISDVVQIIADVNNSLLPLWMIALGTGMIWYSRSSNSFNNAVKKTDGK